MIVDSYDQFHIMAVTRNIVPFGYNIETIHVMWVAALLCVSYHPLSMSHLTTLNK